MADIPLNSEFERVVEDPFAKWAMTWRKELIIAIVIGVLGAWGYSLISSARESEKENAAQAFLSVQRAYDELVTVRDTKVDAGKEEEQKKKVDEAQKKFHAVLTSFSDSGSNYATLVKAYTALVSGETAQNFATLKEGSSDRLVAELAALGVARATLDTDFNKGVSALKVIAHSAGAVATAGAISTLLVVAPTDEEVAQLEKSGVEKYPEIKSILDKIAE